LTQVKRVSKSLCYQQRLPEEKAELGVCANCANLSCALRFIFSGSRNFLLRIHKAFAFEQFALKNNRANAKIAQAVLDYCQSSVTMCL